MNVIVFQSTKKADPYLTGKARCSVCYHEHIAVVPVGTEWIECPVCREVKSRFVQAEFLMLSKVGLD